MDTKRKIIIEVIIAILIILLLLILYNKPRGIELYGNNYLVNTEELNFSDLKIDSFNDLNNKIKNFKELKRVDFGDNVIPQDFYENLIKMYPNVSIEAIKEVDMYGLKVRSNNTELDLSNSSIDNNLSFYLKKLPNLKNVNLTNHTLNVDEMISLKEEFPNIDFVWMVPVLDESVNSNTVTLNLDKKEVNDLSSFYKSLSLLDKLTYLNMGYSNLSNEVLDKMNNDFPNIKIVWTIKFGVWHINTDDIAFSVLISNFPYKRLTSADLDFLKYCKDLQSLDLGHQAITDLSPIVDNLPNLRILILADNKISDIKPLTKLKHLHYIELFMNNIHDFSPIKEMKELVDINVCFNRFSDIEPFKNLPKLERLWLVGCGLSSDKIQELRSIYPNATVNINGPGSTEGGWRKHKRYFAMIDMYYKRNYMSEEFSKYD